MKTETLFERPRIEGTGDSLKQGLKAFGARARDAGLATLGSNKARGRLSIRIITNKLVKDFMAYVGGQDIHPVTDDTVRDYISRYYGQQLAAVEPTIQQLAGGGPPQTPQGQPQPTPAQGQPPQPGVAPVANTQTWTAPTAPQAAPPNNAAPRQSTPADMGRYQALLGQINQSVMNPTPDPQFMNKIAALLKSASASKNLRQYAKQKIDELKARPDVTQRYPEIANIGDDPFASPPPSGYSMTGTQAGGAPMPPATTPYTLNPAAPSGQPNIATSEEPAVAAPATGGWRAVRPGEVFPPGGQYRMNQTTGQSEVNEPPPAASAAPSSEPAAPTAQPGETVQQSVSQIAPILSKPAITPQERWWVMAAVNNALQKTQRGTPQRQQVIATLRALQNNPQATAKIPELKQIPMESHQRVFDLAVFLVENQISDKTALRDAYRRIMRETVAINPSQIDQIFTVLARNLSAEGLAYTQRGGTGGNQQTAQGQSKQGWGSSNMDPQRMMTTTITPQALQSAKKYVNINPHDYQVLVQAAGQNGEKLQQILRSLKNKTTHEMVELLIHAAGNP